MRLAAFPHRRRHLRSELVALHLEVFVPGLEGLDLPLQALHLLNHHGLRGCVGGFLRRAGRLLPRGRQFVLERLLFLLDPFDPLLRGVQQLVIPLFVLVCDFLLHRCAANGRCVFHVLSPLATVRHVRGVHLLVCYRARIFGVDCLGEALADDLNPAHGLQAVAKLGVGEVTVAICIHRPEAPLQRVVSLDQPPAEHQHVVSVVRVLPAERAFELLLHLFGLLSLRVKQHLELGRAFHELLELGRQFPSLLFDFQSALALTVELLFDHGHRFSCFGGILTMPELVQVPVHKVHAEVCCTVFQRKLSIRGEFNSPPMVFAVVSGIPPCPAATLDPAVRPSAAV
mmetsp:Transcript_23694/g.65889  ORF Transcript_23694/g.65889 Transcript_23694/m.65889 type:complete len:342 (+) Transcript_23694:1140-2165(+)